MKIIFYIGKRHYDKLTAFLDMLMKKEIEIKYQKKNKKIYGNASIRLIYQEVKIKRAWV